MRPYLHLISARLRMLLQYRAAALAGFGCQCFWGLIRVMVFAAFYAASTQQQPMELAAVITYIWLGQAMFAMLPWFRDRELERMMRDGNVAYELARPLDLYATWYTRNIASRLAPTLLRALPMFIVALLFLGMQPPASPGAAAAWLIATLGALLLGCALVTLVTVTMLWTIAGEGVSQLNGVLVMLLSGMIVPLPLFPAWCQDILRFLPFSGLADAPFRLYTGHIPVEQLAPILGHQLLWTLALVIAGRALLQRGLRELVVQGG